MTRNIHPDQALTLVESMPETSGTETIPLAEALGRVLAHDVIATVDSPPFDKSSMDGFAVADTGTNPGGYRIDGTCAAGIPFSGRLSAGSCIRIMTGAPVPAGTKLVQRVEWTEEKDGRVTFTKPEPYDNIIKRGENLRSGAPLLSRRKLRPQDLGILASSGFSEIEVKRRISIGVISTGTELVRAGNALRPGTIYDSNGPTLVALADDSAARSSFYGIVPDDPEKTVKVIQTALGECDIVILSGGVSMGEFDFVPKALESLGVEGLFHNLLMKPGKPTWFGRLPSMNGNANGRERYVFGLPGNPVSTFVNFEVFVKALLATLSGTTYRPVTFRAALAKSLTRKTSDRMEWFPVTLDGAAVAPMNYHGSSMLNILSSADALVRMEIGVEELREGGTVDVRLIRA